MYAETLNCFNCGAAVSSDSTQCQYCSSRLATVACSACFRRMFSGSKHCQRCGAAATSIAAADLPARNCPRCRADMQPVTIGTTAVRECFKCAGLWLDVTSFEKICADREQQSAVLGAASPAPTHTATDAVSKISYVPCPECAQLMNRINFARCSGVIVDVCRGHGTWFDRDELSRIIEFIREGGLEAARNKEKAHLEEARRQLEAERLRTGSGRSLGLGSDEDEHRLSGIASARGLLKILLD
jgi:Zn-finger nucleic acid-binding protein